MFKCGQKWQQITVEVTTGNIPITLHFNKTKPFNTINKWNKDISDYVPV